MYKFRLVCPLQVNADVVDMPRLVHMLTVSEAMLDAYGTALSDAKAKELARTARTLFSETPGSSSVAHPIARTGTRRGLAPPKASLKFKATKEYV
jgi:hypothetical protein